MAGPHAALRRSDTHDRLVRVLLCCAFFAICRATGTSCVWGLNLDEAEKHIDPAVLDLIAKDQNARERKTFEAVFTGSTPGVVNVSPFRLNERLVIQQGTFLVPRNIRMSFDDNLASLLRVAAPSPLVKFRISGKRSVRRELLQRLQRMNISMATLFPGLDGFAQSLEQLFAFPDVIVRRAPDRLTP